MELSKRGQNLSYDTWCHEFQKLPDRLSLKTDNYQLCINLPTILKKLGGVTPPTPPRSVRPCQPAMQLLSLYYTVATGFICPVN